MAPAARDHGARGQSKNEMISAGRSFEAPPSTLAANLVNNLSTTRRTSKNAEQEDFQRLLAEVSRYEDQLHDDLSIEAVLERHHKTIYVMVKAVLDPLTKGGPLLSEDDMLQQGSDGLDILIATIRETPTVLIHVAGPGVGFQSGANVPLWVWLFPRLLSLVGLQRCDILLEKISALFQECFTAVSRSPQLWALNTLFFVYLQHCTESKF
jgi:serine/threonine-protein kinase ATR